MKRIAIILALAGMSIPAQATECRGLLSLVFGVKPLFSCEQRRIMLGAAVAMQPRVCTTTCSPYPPYTCTTICY